MDSATGVAIVVIVMRHSRNRQRCTSRTSGLKRQGAGWELVFVHQSAVIRAPHVRSQKQMTRVPNVTKEREHGEHRDDRPQHLPAARLTSDFATKRSHGD